MSKLEEEYDYETDELHVANGKRVLNTDLYHAVEFFVNDNPLLFVENFERGFWYINQTILKLKDFN